jgi:methylglyoxal synthase
VVEVQMTQKYGAHAAECHAGFGELRDGPVAGVDEVGLTIDDQCIRRLRPLSFAVRPARCAEHDEFVTGLLRAATTESGAAKPAAVGRAGTAKAALAALRFGAVNQTKTQRKTRACSNDQLFSHTT